MRPSRLFPSLRSFRWASLSWLESTTPMELLSRECLSSNPLATAIAFLRAQFRWNEHPSSSVEKFFRNDAAERTAHQQAATAHSDDLFSRNGKQKFQQLKIEKGVAVASQSSSGRSLQ